MKRVVQKYGGSSVATPIKLRRVARRIRESIGSGTEVVVVVSAMGDTTDELIALAHRVTGDPPSREMDMLLSSGETITAPLLAMALHAAGTPAISLTGAQAGIRTSRAHRTARIVDIVPQRVLDELERGNVVVVAGFQGATEDMDVTTLGRGGSDTTAVALAVAIHADHCEIFTDVPGVHTADPRIVADARVIPEIDYDEMLELASAGARVMHPRAVEIGEAYSMEIRVRSTFDNEPGTIIARHSEMEIRQKVRAIAHETDVAKVTLLRVPDRPGVAAAIFGPFGDAGIDVDIVLQNVGHDGTTDVSFTIAESDLPKARRMLAIGREGVGAQGHHANAGVAKVTVIGSGLKGTPGLLREDLPRPCREGHQHPDDRDERDPRHLHHRPAARSRRRARAAHGLRAGKDLSLTVGIVGLPNAGKSTLFNAMTQAGAAVGNYPFTTIEPNTGVVAGSGLRASIGLAALFQPPKVIPATVTFTDIAGLVRGASRGEGLGNRFLGNIREADATALVVRAFEDPDVTHVEGRVDPIRDIDVLELELQLADLETMTKRLERTEKSARACRRKRSPSLIALLHRVQEHLDQGSTRCAP